MQSTKETLTMITIYIRSWSALALALALALACEGNIADIIQRKRKE